MQFWNLLAILSFAITGVFSASASIRHHEATRRVLDAKDYQIVLDAWRERLKDDYQVRGLAEAKIISGNVFLTGCNFNETFGSVSVGFLDEWNDFADRIFGTLATGWIYSDKYRWAFWRDIEGTVPCPVPYGVKGGETFVCPEDCALLRNWVGN